MGSWYYWKIIKGKSEKEKYNEQKETSEMTKKISTIEELTDDDYDGKASQVIISSSIIIFIIPEFLFVRYTFLWLGSDFPFSDFPIVSANPWLIYSTFARKAAKTIPDLYHGMLNRIGDKIDRNIYHLGAL